MKIRSAGEEVEVLLSDPRPQEPVIEDTPAEIRRVVARLKSLLPPWIEIGRRMGIALGAEDFLAVFEALLAEADQLNPMACLECSEELRLYWRQSLYEELLAEPSNILYSTVVNEDVVRFEAMPTSFWKTCILQLRNQIQEANPEIPVRPELEVKISQPSPARG